MTPAERRVWAASHNLPKNMLLVTVDEMNGMREAFNACLREVELWRQIGQKHLKADLPETFEAALVMLIAEKKKQEMFAEKAPRPLFIVQPPDPKVKAATVRPSEV